MDLAAVLQMVTGIIASYEPVVARAITVGEGIVADLKAQGADLTPFAAEIAAFDAVVSAGLGANAAWRARHGLPPLGQSTAPPAP